MSSSKDSRCILFSGCNRARSNREKFSRETTNEAFEKGHWEAVNFESARSRARGQHVGARTTCSERHGCRIQTRGSHEEQLLPVSFTGIAYIHTYWRFSRPTRNTWLVQGCMLNGGISSPSDRLCDDRSIDLAKSQDASKDLRWIVVEILFSNHVERRQFFR